MCSLFHTWTPRLYIPSLSTDFYSQSLFFFWIWQIFSRALLRDATEFISKVNPQNLYQNSIPKTYIKTKCIVVSDKEFYFFPTYDYVKHKIPKARPILTLGDIIWTILKLVEVNLRILHTKHLSSIPSEFLQD